MLCRKPDKERIVKAWIMLMLYEVVAKTACQPLQAGDFDCESALR